MGAAARALCRAPTAARSWLAEKQVEQIIKRADSDENEVIDFEEFVKEAPRTLRVNLVKLAKQNGHDLGFLA